MSSHWEIGVASARVTFHLEGNKEFSFAWGIGTATNNQDEALTLWQGISLMNNKGISKMTIIGLHDDYLSYGEHKCSYHGQFICDNTSYSQVIRRS